MKNILMILCMAACLATQAWAEPAWKASLAVSEEYTDNAEEERGGRTDFVTSLIPSLGYRYEGGRALLESSYTGAWKHYARGTEDQEFDHDLNVHGLLDVWQNFLFLDVKDTYSLVNEDATRGERLEEDSGDDLVQQNRFTFSPFITPRFGERTETKLGYRYTNIWYDDDDYEKKNIHAGFVDVIHELTPTTSLLSGYSSTWEMSDEEGDLNRHIVYVGASYEYGEGSRVFAKVGPQYTRYSDSDESSTSLFWDAGWTHDFGSVLLDVTTGVTFEDDPETGQTYDKQFLTTRLTKEFQRTVVSVFVTLEDYEEEGDGYSESRRKTEYSIDSGRRTYTGFSVKHELTSRLTGTVNAAYDLNDESSEDVKRWHAGIVFKYALAEDLDAELWYRYKDVSGEEDEEDNYTANRIGMLVRKTF